MKVCVFGVGAVGGTMGYGLAKAGCELSGLARGATLDALRTKGLRFVDGNVTGSVPIRVSADASDLGPQDLVVLAVKAPALREAAPQIAPLLGPDTMVLPAMNGVPWWFFQGFGGELEGRRLNSVDPGGKMAGAIPAAAVIGCVVHLGASCPEPGMATATAPRRFILGEPSGASTRRLENLCGLFRAAGFEVDRSDHIQSDVWYKLWGNMTMNPLSAIAGATMDRVLADPLVARFSLDIMEEAKRIGTKIGCPIEQSCEDRLEISRKLGAIRTSMLQDVEAGRRVELDALVTSVKEIGGLLGEATPNIDILLGLTRLHARTRGLYPLD